MLNIWFHILVTNMDFTFAKTVAKVKFLVTLTVLSTSFQMHFFYSFKIDSLEQWSHIYVMYQDKNLIFLEYWRPLNSSHISRTILNRRLPCISTPYRSSVRFLMYLFFNRFTLKNVLMTILGHIFNVSQCNEWSPPLCLCQNIFLQCAK